MEFFLSCFEKGGESAQGWYGWYAINRDSQTGQKALVGAGGYFGPPDASGIVEIGYSILPEWQRLGYASEIVRMLVTHAFSFKSVTKIIAHAEVGNQGSTGVLKACGFIEVGIGEGQGHLRFELGV